MPFFCHFGPPPPSILTFSVARYEFSIHKAGPIRGFSNAIHFLLVIVKRLLYQKMFQIRAGYLSLEIVGWSEVGTDTFLFCIASSYCRLPIHWKPRELVLPAVKWPGCEAGHVPTSDTAVRNSWHYNCIPPYVWKKQVLYHVSISAFNRPLLNENNFLSLFCWSWSKEELALDLCESIWHSHYNV